MLLNRLFFFPGSFASTFIHLLFIKFRILIYILNRIINWVESNKNNNMSLNCLIRWVLWQSLSYFLYSLWPIDYTTLHLYLPVFNKHFPEEFHTFIFDHSGFDNIIISLLCLKLLGWAFAMKKPVQNKLYRSSREHTLCQLLFLGP